MTATQNTRTPLVRAERRHECDTCEHYAHVEAIFSATGRYYFWPQYPMCPYCQRVMPDVSNGRLS